MEPRKLLISDRRFYGNRLSDLVQFSLEAARRVEGNPNFELVADNWFLPITKSMRTKCMCCLAGAVLVDQLPDIYTYDSERTGLFFVGHSLDENTINIDILNVLDHIIWGRLQNAYTVFYKNSVRAALPLIYLNKLRQLEYSMQVSISDKLRRIDDDVQDITYLKLSLVDIEKSLNLFREIDEIWDAVLADKDSECQEIVKVKEDT